jgi:hypothetical protein
MAESRGYGGRVTTPAKPHGKSPATQTLRYLVGAVMGALFLMAVALTFVLGLGAPPLLSVLLLLLLGAGAWFVIEGVGYRAKPVAPNLDPDAARQAAMNQFQSALMRRLAISESVAIIGIALAFVSRTVVVYDVGASVSVLLLLVHVWPSERSVDRVVTQLERDGAQTGLREMLGFGGSQDGPVTRLG